MEGVKGCPRVDRVLDGTSHGLDQVVEALIVASLAGALKGEGGARAYALVAQAQGLVEDLSRGG